jgi:hypothetical protein
VSLRDRIFALDDIATETVNVPEWDCTVLVKGMTARDRLEMMQKATDEHTGEVTVSNVYPDVIIACCYDPDTDLPLFEEGDKAALLGKAYKAIESLAVKAMTLSGMGTAPVDESGKDSSSSPNGGSA